VILIIDAHVVHCYYIEDRDLGSHEATAEVTELFEGLARIDELWLDDGGHVMQEWRQLVTDTEWFDGWFFTLTQNSRVFSLPAPAARQLLATLGRDFGFPRGSGDRWYISLAAAVRDALDVDPAIVSEDMHLHEPRSRHLHGRARERILIEGRGAMARWLARRQRIHVRCVARHVASDQPAAD
jgi:hypothetical protein